MPRLWTEEEDPAFQRYVARMRELDKLDKAINKLAMEHIKESQAPLEPEEYARYGQLREQDRLTRERQGLQTKMEAITPYEEAHFGPEVGQYREGLQRRRAAVESLMQGKPPTVTEAVPTRKGLTFEKGPFGGTMILDEEGNLKRYVAAPTEKKTGGKQLTPDQISKYRYFKNFTQNLDPALLDEQEKEAFQKAQEYVNTIDDLYSQGAIAEFPGAPQAAPARTGLEAPPRVGTEQKTVGQPQIYIHPETKQKIFWNGTQWQEVK